MMINKPMIQELKKKPHNIAAEIIGVKFGGCGSNLEAIKIKTTKNCNEKRL